MSDQDILPCVMCEQHHEQMLMLSCMHDCCINCAAVHYCSTQPSNSNVYMCEKCGEYTELDSSSIVELQRVYHQLKKKKYDYKRNLGGIGQSAVDSYEKTNSRQTHTHKRKLESEPAQTYVQPVYTPVSQPYNPISQPSNTNNPYSNISVRKVQVSTYMCETHPEQQLSYFCFDCSSPICPQCAIHGSHREHEVQTTRKAIKNIKTSLQQCTDGVNQQIQSVTGVRESYRMKMKDYVEENKRDKDNIKKTFDTLRSLLSEKEKQFQKTVDISNESNTRILRDENSECEKIIEHHNTVKKNIEATLKKEDLAILQDYNKREKEAKMAIESSKNKKYNDNPEGMKEIDYDLFKDEMEQLSGIINGLKLTARSRK